MKKGIIKKTVMLGLGLVLAAGLVGCSGQKEDKKASDTNTKKEIVMGLDNTFVPMGFLNDKNELEHLREQAIQLSSRILTGQ